MSINIDYDQLASDYAVYRTRDAVTLEHLVARSGISSTSKVLEIGCGTGNYISQIQKRVACQCVGVDSSKAMIEEAKQANQNLSFQIEPAERLSAADDTFDFAFSVDVLHHVGNQQAYFQEACRVLKRGGLLATVTDSEDTIRRRMPLSFYFPETVEAELKRYASIELLRSSSLKAGFEIVGEEIVERKHLLTQLDPYARKAFSCLRLISENAFLACLDHMKQDLKKGPILCISRNFVLWIKKKEAQRLL